MKADQADHYCHTVTKDIRRIAAWALLFVWMIFTVWQAYVMSTAYETAQSFQNRHYAVLDALPVGVIKCDEHGVITFANAEAASLIGWDSKQMIGESVTSFLPPKQAERHRKQQASFVRSLKNRSGNWQVTKRLEGTIYNHNGEEIPVVVRMRGISFEKEIILIATIAKINTTERAVAEPFNEDAIDHPHALIPDQAMR